MTSIASTQDPQALQDFLSSNSGSLSQGNSVRTAVGALASALGGVRGGGGIIGSFRGPQYSEEDNQARRAVSAKMQSLYELRTQAYLDSLTPEQLAAWDRQQKLSQIDAAPPPEVPATFMPDVLAQSEQLSQQLMAPPTKPSQTPSGRGLLGGGVSGANTAQPTSMPQSQQALPPVGQLTNTTAVPQASKNMQVISSSIDPDLKQAYLNQINAANAVANRPYQQYEGPQVASLTADQQAAFQGVRNLQGQERPFIEGAAGALGGLMFTGAPQINAPTAGLGSLGSAQGYSPTMSSLGTLGNAQGYNVANASAGTLGNAATMNAAAIRRGDIRNVAAQNFLQGNVGAYMNPYTSQVIDSSMRDIDRARQLQQQQVNAQAAARGAYGGSRQAIAEAENNRNYLDQQARTISGLRQQGFDTAANLMQADMNRSLQADMSNQGMDFNVGQQNAGFQQQANAANQQARNQFELTRYGTEADTSRFNAANQTAANQYLAGAQNQFGLSRFGAENANNQFNANNANAASQFGANAQNQFALSNFGAQNNLNQFNASNNLAAQTANAGNFLQGNMQRMQAANQFANLGALNQQIGLGNAQALAGMGGIQQQQVQRNYDAARADFERQFNYPLQQLAIRQSALPAPNAFGGTESKPLFENTAANVLGALATGAGALKNLDIKGTDIFNAGTALFNSLPSFNLPSFNFLNPFGSRSSTGNLTGNFDSNMG